MDLALFLLLLVLVSIVAGVVGSLTVLGGGVVMIPVLVVLFVTSSPSRSAPASPRFSRPPPRPGRCTSGTT